MVVKQGDTKQCMGQPVNQKTNGKYIETNENENTMVRNLQGVAMSMLKGKYIAIQAYLKKEEEFQIHFLTLPLKELETEQQRKPKARRMTQSIRAEINDIEIKITIEQINETRSSFLEKKISKIDKALSRHNQKGKRKDPNN